MVSDSLQPDWGRKGVRARRSDTSAGTRKVNPKGANSRSPVSRQVRPCNCVTLPNAHLPRASSCPHARRFPFPRSRLDPIRNQILTSIGEVIYDWDIGSDRLSWGPNVAQILDSRPRKISRPAASTEICSARRAVNRAMKAVARSQDADQGSGVPYRVCYALEVTNAGAQRAPVWLKIAADGAMRAASPPARTG